MEEVLDLLGGIMKVKKWSLVSLYTNVHERYIQCVLNTYVGCKYKNPANKHFFSLTVYNRKVGAILKLDIMLGLSRAHM